MTLLSLLHREFVPLCFGRPQAKFSALTSETCNHTNSHWFSFSSLVKAADGIEKCLWSRFISRSADAPFCSAVMNCPQTEVNWPSRDLSRDLSHCANSSLQLQIMPQSRRMPMTGKWKTFCSTLRVGKHEKRTVSKKKKPFKNTFNCQKERNEMTFLLFMFSLFCFRKTSQKWLR